MDSFNAKLLASFLCINRAMYVAQHANNYIGRLLDSTSLSGNGRHHALSLSKIMCILQIEILVRYTILFLLNNNSEQSCPAKASGT